MMTNTTSPAILQDIKVDAAPQCASRGKTIIFKNANQVTFERSKKVFCETCGQQFASARALTDHKRQSKKRYRCELCPRDFPWMGSLRRHQRRHERRYACVHCCQRFKEKGVLRQHLETHNPNRERYICSINGCYKVFQRTGDYTRHVRFIHGTQTFTCRYCQKDTFKRSDIKIRHERLCFSRLERANDPVTAQTPPLLEEGGTQPLFEIVNHDLTPPFPSPMDIDHGFASGGAVSMIPEQAYPLDNHIPQGHYMDNTHHTDAETYLSSYTAPPTATLELETDYFQVYDEVDMTMFNTASNLQAHLPIEGPLLACQYPYGLSVDDTSANIYNEAGMTSLNTIYAPATNLQTTPPLPDFAYFYNMPLDTSLLHAKEAPFEMTMTTVTDLQHLDTVYCDFMGNGMEGDNAALAWDTTYFGHFDS